MKNTHLNRKFKQFHRRKKSYKNSKYKQALAKKKIILIIYMNNLEIKDPKKLFQKKHEHKKKKKLYSHKFQE